jgi:predicted ATP-dependent serine protease
MSSCDRCGYQHGLLDGRCGTCRAVDAGEEARREVESDLVEAADRVGPAVFNEPYDARPVVAELKSAIRRYEAVMTHRNLTP